MCDHDPNREAAMIVIERDERDEPTVWCDPCIEPLVSALNQGGIKTVASCCGHGTHPTIVIDSQDRWLLLVPRKQADEILELLYPPHRAGSPEAHAWESARADQWRDQRARADRAEERIAAALAIHSRYIGHGADGCDACRQPWPCPTVRALTIDAPIRPEDGAR